jgi:hypothetical protein
VQGQVVVNPVGRYVALFSPSLFAIEVLNDAFLS